MSSTTEQNVDMNDNTTTTTTTTTATNGQASAVKVNSRSNDQDAGVTQRRNEGTPFEFDSFFSDSFFRDPLSEFRRVSRRMDRLFDQMSRSFGMDWEPGFEFGRRWGVPAGTPAMLRQPESRTDTLEAPEASAVEGPASSQKWVSRMPEMGKWSWAPVCNLVEKDNEFQLEAELPGIAKDQVNVEVVGDTLRISGESKSERKEEKDQYHLYERSFGSFQRSLRLPQNAEKDQIRAEFKDGLLTVHIAKNKAVENANQSQRIAIQ